MPNDSSRKFEELRTTVTPALTPSSSINLRPVDLDDTENYMALVAKNNEFLTPWFKSFTPPNTAEDRRKEMAKRFEEVRNHERYWWMIEFDGELVGKIDIHGMYSSNRSGSIGYWIDQDYTGKGIATLSVKTVIDWAFTVHNFNKIEIVCAIQNTPSIAVPERLGIRREAILRKENVVNGEVQDMAIYTAFADNWPPEPPERALPPKRIQVDEEILLRTYIDEDVGAQWRAIESGRNYLSEYLPWIETYPNESEHERLFNRRRWEKDNFDGSLGYAIEYMGEFAGGIGFGVPNRDNGIEVGYWLRQDLQGRGIMTRCVEAIITMLFVEVGLHRVTIRAATTNLPSRGIPERLGLTHEGTMRQGGLVKDEYFDLEIYSMLDHEWLDRSQNT